MHASQQANSIRARSTVLHDLLLIFGRFHHRYLGLQQETSFDWAFRDASNSIHRPNLAPKLFTRAVASPYKRLIAPIWTSTPHAMPRLLAVLGLIALLFSTACAMVTLLLAIALTMRRSPVAALALSAGVLDVLAIGWVAYLLAGITFKDHTTLKRKKFPIITLVPSMLLSTVAISLTFATLIWIHLQSVSTMDTIFGSRIYLINKTDFGFWAATVLSQSLFLALCFYEPYTQDIPPQNTGLSQDLVDALLHTQAEPQGIPQPVPLRNFVPVPAIPHCTRSLSSAHSVSTFSSDGKSTTHSSFQGAVRPVTSRSRLIWQNPGSGPSNAMPALAIPRQRPTYDHTLASRRSSVDVSTDEEQSPPQTPVKTRLETIPGSRANSPARPLDGPFPDQPLAEETNQSRECSRAPSLELQKSSVEVEDVEESPIDESRIPPRFRKEPPPPRPTSPTLDQSFIHPLFRTDNHLPAPTATSSSTVIASAFGGQTMTPRSLSRVTTRSRPTSPDGTGSTVLTRARSHSKPPGRFTDQLAPPPAAMRAKSMEAVHTRKALQDISGNAPALPITAAEKTEWSFENTDRREAFVIAADN